MQFLVTAYDGENCLEKRLAVRTNHIENILKINGKVLCAGGLLDEEGKMKGSALVMEFASREELDDYLAHEPYITAGVWEKVTIERMNVVIFDNEKVGK